MEKILVISCILISLVYSARTQEYVYDFSAMDSIARPLPDAINVEEKAVEGKVVSKTPILNLPDKGARDKKKSGRNGLYVVLNSQGDTQFIGNYRKGRLNGEWKSWFNNRVVCDSGLLINDLPDGTWKGWYANGNPRYILHFSARKLHSLKDELIRQPRTKYFILSQKPPAEASRHYNARLLFGHKTAEDNTLVLSRQVNHPAYSPEALQKLVAANTNDGSGKGYTAPFTEGLLHGEFTSFHSNGTIKETGLYLNGLREGMWEEYSLQLEKAVGTYRHGYRNGEWRYYSAQGKLLYWKRFDAKGRESEKYSFTSIKE